ncbi:hypothetical protein KQX54_006428 [Cotesia glomerata]|uniref:Uncharacterized protein n=1 Tax=Cotesia glomerata TaxID=32391 RepID=A0AAV7I7C7_COTGL|nr:hypothetical protein KQX54_006428 [Cotesia glomerata]
MVDEFRQSKCPRDISNRNWSLVSVLWSRALGPSNLILYPTSYFRKEVVCQPGIHSCQLAPPNACISLLMSDSLLVSCTGFCFYSSFFLPQSGTLNPSLSWRTRTSSMILLYAYCHSVLFCSMLLLLSLYVISPLDTYAFITLSMIITSHRRNLPSLACVDEILPRGVLQEQFVGDIESDEVDLVPEFDEGFDRTDFKTEFSPSPNLENPEPPLRNNNETIDATTVDSTLPRARTNNDTVVLAVLFVVKPADCCPPPRRQEFEPSETTDTEINYTDEPYEDETWKMQRKSYRKKKHIHKQLSQHHHVITDSEEHGVDDYRINKPLRESHRWVDHNESSITHEYKQSWESAF